MRRDDRHELIRFLVTPKEELALVFAERAWANVWLDRSRVEWRRRCCLNVKLHSRTSANCLLTSSQIPGSFPSLRECRDSWTRNIYRRTTGPVVLDRQLSRLVRVARPHASCWCCFSNSRRGSETECESPSLQDCNPTAKETCR